MELLAVTYRPQSSQIRLGSEKSLSHKFIPVPSPGMVTNLMPIQDAKTVEPVCFYHCMKYPYVITIENSDTNADTVTAPALPEV